MDVYSLVKKDLDNVVLLSNKYDLNIASWYWRLNETEDEWIDRLVKLSIETKQVRGYILGVKTSLTYIIPLDDNLDEVIIHMCTKNMQTKEIKTSYALLYETLENYLQE